MIAYPSGIILKSTDIYLYKQEINRTARLGTISFFPLFSQFSKFVKISHLYLTGFAAAQLKWHQLNTNVIQRSATFTKFKILPIEKINECRFSNSHPREIYIIYHEWMIYNIINVLYITGL